MTRVWVPGYDEVLEIFERYKKANKNIEKAKNALMSICWQQTAYIRRDPVKAYQEAPALQRYIELRETRNEELIRQIEKVKPLEKQVLEMLDLLDDPHKTILMMYYVLDYSWVKVSMEINLADSRCRQLRDQALAIIATTNENRRKIAENTNV